MTPPDAPDGYTPYQPYEIPEWAKFIAAFILAGVWVVVVRWLDVTVIGEGVVGTAVGAPLGISATIFLHESLHYITDAAMGYDPVYLWPNKVYIPNEGLSVGHGVISLLAPQLLSLTYIFALAAAIPSGLQIALGWGLVINLAASGQDVSWVVRRVTWPAGNRVAVGEDHRNYVAFPEE